MALDVIICIAAVGAMGYGSWWILKWFFKLGSAQVKKSESLTPADLRVLEETAKRIMDDLNKAADECIARVERTCILAQQQIAPAQTPIEIAEPEDTRHTARETPAESDTPQKIQPGLVPATPCTEHTVASFAKSVGLTTGEVQLMRELRKYAGQKMTN